MVKLFHTSVLLSFFICHHRFKEEEKERKLAQKKARQDAIRHKIEEEERVQMIINFVYLYYQ